MRPTPIRLCLLGLLALFSTGCVMTIDETGTAFDGGVCLDESCVTTCTNGFCETSCTTNDCTPADTAVVGSCQGRCGEETFGAVCQCDAACIENGDCCGDFEAMCVVETRVVRTQVATSADTAPEPAGTCAARCGTYDQSASCQCDPQCVEQGDCCADEQALCATSPVKSTPVQPRQAASAAAEPVAGSCANRCGDYNKELTCQCDDKCAENGDCCTDLANVCSTPKNKPASPTTSAGSCADRCDEYSKDATCQCDNKCAENGDCCTDLSAMCTAK
ncbi:MAG: hypothetical protein KC502_16535 [Myxococcales bacterium]|nr:hypothetical protein [Myxococcales bacterium]